MTPDQDSNNTHMTPDDITSRDGGVAAAPRPGALAASNRPGTGPRGTVRKHLSEILLEQGAINEAQLAQAHARQREGADAKLDVTAILFKAGHVNEDQLARARAVQVGIPFMEQDKYSPAAKLSPEALEVIPAQVANSFNVLPLGRSVDGTKLRVVASHWSAAAMEACKEQTSQFDLGIEPYLGGDKSVRAAIKYYYSDQSSQPSMTNGTPNKPVSAVPVVVDPRKSALPSRVAPVDRRASDVLSAAANPSITFAGQQQDNRDENVDIGDFSVDQPAIIQMVNKLIADAINHRASDIHFEPMRDGVLVKYRVDGALSDWDKVPKGFANACTSRLKVMADMNIAERRVPQDGRITVKTGGRTVDMRVSSLPTQYGEAIVLRILDRTSMRLDVNTLGFEERNLRTLHNLIKKPHGIFLATGPTGSGKTTTLYAAIAAIKSPDINIITVEDPIEYELDGVRQSNTNDKAGLTFAKQLRAILRQDPDVIYVGEIRDAETAEIGFRAALTGHLVFSTLHCNEASAAVTRLLNMGMDPFLIASSVIGVLAQRLVRKVCANCSAPYRPPLEELGLLGLDPESSEVRNANFRMGTGCPDCNHSGYKGRISVQELMVMDEHVRALTLERATSTKIRQVASTMGNNPMISMRRDAAMKVMSGLTTCEEVQKRVMLDEE